MMHITLGWARQVRPGKRIMVVATLVTMFAATLGLSEPASAATVRCWPTSGPASYSGHGFISGWGRIDCSASVAWIDITVSLERDGWEVYNGHHHATRLPGNGLINVLHLFDVACDQSGNYRIVTSGSAPGIPLLGTASVPDPISCGPIS
jgi:hypothetical protein